MNNIFRKGKHSISKIVCLALGLAISSVIIAEIYFEQTFDTYFPGSDRTYIIQENATFSNGSGAQTFDQTSGGVAPGIKHYAPMVEAATRALYEWGNDTQLKLLAGNAQGEKTVESNITMTDSAYFDVFPQRILAGNPHEVLSRKNYVMISSDLAKTIGGNVVGRRFTIDSAPGVTFTIGGVFEAFPWRASQHGDGVYLSLCSIGQFTYDGRNMWVGNDSYRSFIRLAKGHKADELQPYVAKMMQDNYPLKDMQKAGVKMSYSFVTPNEDHTSDSYLKMMKWILSIVAFVLLFTSVMNYLLIVIGNMVSRSREMAVRKCFGAERSDIYKLLFREAAWSVSLSVLLAAVLIFVCKGAAENFLSVPVASLLFNKGAWILVVILLIVLFIGGFVPGWLYNHIPVTVAFRGYVSARRKWKLGVLAVQFTIVALMLSLLWIINSQYGKLMNLDPGYDYNNVAILTVQGSTSTDRQRTLTELQRMPGVQQVSAAQYLPLEEWYGSGDDVTLPGDSKQLFNAEDMYWVNDNYFKLLNIKIQQGTWFTDLSDSCRQVMVDVDFADKLQKLTGWKDGVVGKQIDISGHEPIQTFTIVGVFRPVQMGSASQTQGRIIRPAMVFYAKSVQGDMLLKLSELTPQSMQTIREKVETMFPGKKVVLTSYATEYGNQYINQRNFRNGILIGGIVVLVIALFGLVGYTMDEVSRRSKEIAIRKVNGATVRDILELFIRDIMKVAVPSVVVGCIGGWLISAWWLQNFSQRITLTPIPFLVVTLVILLIISLSVVLNSYAVAVSNPVKYLKDE